MLIKQNILIGIDLSEFGLGEMLLKTYKIVL